MKGFYTDKEVKDLALKKGITVIEDVCLVLVKGDIQKPLYVERCQERPPYRELFLKNKVNACIESFS